MYPLELLKGQDKPIAGRVWKRILLIQLAYIGDVVVTMPLVRTLRVNYPKSRIVVCTREHSRELIEDCPWVDAAISVDRRKRGALGTLAHHERFFRKLRKERFELVMDVRTGTRGAYIARLSGAPVRIRPRDLRSPFYNRFFTHLVALPGLPLKLHASEYYLGFSAPLGLEGGDAAPRLFVPPARQGRALEILADAGVPQGEPVVALHPFSAYKYKEWKPEHCAALVDRIRARYGVPVVITGAPVDKVPAERIAGLCESQVFNLAGKTSIGELAAVLGECDFLVAVDTGAVHVAAAVGTPTLTLFGPSNHLLFNPPGRGARRRHEGHALRSLRAARL